jgi:polyvinyl alcohol dehydrogenase (cytochrome)
MIPQEDTSTARGRSHTADEAPARRALPHVFRRVPSPKILVLSGIAVLLAAMLVTLLSPVRTLAGLLGQGSTRPNSTNYVVTPFPTSATVRPVGQPTPNGTVSPTAAPATPLPLSSADWSTYMNGLARTGFDNNTAPLDAANIASLQVHWTQHAASISTEPAEAGGILYWGSWDGTMHATTLSGTTVWTTSLGETSDSSCNPGSAGITGTATIGAIGSTQVVYIAGGNDTFYALNAANGDTIWSTQIGTQPQDFIWDSPALYNGSIYISVSSLADCPIVAGRVVQLNAASGAIEHTFYPTPGSNCQSGGIWSSPTIDATADLVYVSVGNGDCGSLYTTAIVSLHADNLSPADSWQVPVSQQTNDSDFGATPTLFTATINGVSRAMVGVGNKNGVFYAFDRNNLGAGPIWQSTVASGGECPQCGDGTISSAAWDGTTLYVAGGKTTINGQSCGGSVRAFDPATGNVRFAHCFTQGTVIGALTVIPGAVIATHGRTVSVLNASDGSTVYEYTDDNSNSVFFSGVTISHGMLFAPNFNGDFLAFGL